MRLLSIAIPKAGFVHKHLKAVYDNSAGNPRNPFNPPREVGWGEESTDEMCLVIIGMILE